MTVRVFIVGSLLASIIAWAAWILIIFYLDPLQAGTLGYVLFFLSLFLAIASTAGIIGYFIRRLVIPDQLATYTVRTALRQGVLLGLFFNLLLFLQLTSLYLWWIGIVAIILFLSTELIFLSYDRVVNSRGRQAADK